MRPPAVLAGAGAAAAGALVALSAVDDAAVDRVADGVLVLALLVFARAAFRLVDVSDEIGLREDAASRKRRAGGR